MEQIGKVFGQLRESRNISMRQATGDNFRRLCCPDLKQVRVSFGGKVSICPRKIYLLVWRNPLSGERFSV